MFLPLANSLIQEKKPETGTEKTAPDPPKPNLNTPSKQHKHYIPSKKNPVFEIGSSESSISNSKNIANFDEDRSPRPPELNKNSSNHVKNNRTIEAFIKEDETNLLDNVMKMKNFRESPLKFIKTQNKSIAAYNIQANKKKSLQMSVSELWHHKLYKKTMKTVGIGRIKDQKHVRPQQMVQPHTVQFTEEKKSEIKNKIKEESKMDLDSYLGVEEKSTLIKGLAKLMNYDNVVNNKVGSLADIKEVEEPKNTEKLKIYPKKCKTMKNIKISSNKGSPVKRRHEDPLQRPKNLANNNFLIRTKYQVNDCHETNSIEKDQFTAMIKPSSENIQIVESEVIPILNCNENFDEDENLNKPKSIIERSVKFQEPFISKPETVMCRFQGIKNQKLDISRFDCVDDYSNHNKKDLIITSQDSHLEQTANISQTSIHKNNSANFHQTKKKIILKKGNSDKSKLSSPEDMLKKLNNTEENSITKNINTDFEKFGWGGVKPSTNIIGKMIKKQAYFGQSVLGSGYYQTNGFKSMLPSNSKKYVSTTKQSGDMISSIQNNSSLQQSTIQHQTNIQETSCLSKGKDNSQNQWQQQSELSNRENSELDKTHKYHDKIFESKYNNPQNDKYKKRRSVKKNSLMGSGSFLGFIKAKNENCFGNFLDSEENSVQKKQPKRHSKKKLVMNLEQPNYVEQITNKKRNSIDKNKRPSIAKINNPNCTGSYTSHLFPKTNLPAQVDNKFSSYFLGKSCNVQTKIDYNKTTNNSIQQANDNNKKQYTLNSIQRGSMKSRNSLQSSAGSQKNIDTSKQKSKIPSSSYQYDSKDNISHQFQNKFYNPTNTTHTKQFSTKNLNASRADPSNNSNIYNYTTAVSKGILYGNHSNNKSNENSQSQINNSIIFQTPSITPTPTKYNLNCHDKKSNLINTTNNNIRGSFYENSLADIDKSSNLYSQGIQQNPKNKKKPKRHSKITTCNQSDKTIVINKSKTISTKKLTFTSNPNIAYHNKTQSAVIPVDKRNNHETNDSVIQLNKILIKDINSELDHSKYNKAVLKYHRENQRRENTKAYEEIKCRKIKNNKLSNYVKMMFESSKNKLVEECPVSMVTNQGSMPFDPN